MEKYQSLQNLFTILAALCQILAIIFGLVIYHYKNKKDEIMQKSKIENAQHSKVEKDVKMNNFNVKDLIKSKIENGKNEVAIKIEPTNPNALIVTHNQSGGQNIVNYNGDKFNPANLKNEPIFEKTGYYGINILDNNVTVITAGKEYSVSANIPSNGTLRMTLQKQGDIKMPLWGMNVISIKNWRYTQYDHVNHFQQYDLDESFGDMAIIFNQEGSAILRVYYNAHLINEKIIVWK